MEEEQIDIEAVLNETVAKLTSKLNYSDIINKISSSDTYNDVAWWLRQIEDNIGDPQKVLVSVIYIFTIVPRFERQNEKKRFLAKLGRVIEIINEKSNNPDFAAISLVCLSNFKDMIGNNYRQMSKYLYPLIPKDGFALYYKDLFNYLQEYCQTCMLENVPRNQVLELYPNLNDFNQTGLRRKLYNFCQFSNVEYILQTMVETTSHAVLDFESKSQIMDILNQNLIDREEKQILSALKHLTDYPAGIIDRLDGLLMEKITTGVFTREVLGDLVIHKTNCIGTYFRCFAHDYIHSHQLLKEELIPMNSIISKHLDKDSLSDKEFEQLDDLKKFVTSEIIRLSPLLEKIILYIQSAFEYILRKISYTD